jgi:outer membrane protein OmpA-like peptidoglycan-associated protein
MGRLIAIVLAVVLLVLPAALVMTWTSSAEERLVESERTASKSAPAVAVAAEANEAYCTPELKQILRRVLASCGLLGGQGGRGCQPLEAKNVATLGGSDFNALFVPMQNRGGIVQFELGSSELDERSTTLIDRVFADRAGASYFFVVARASQDGATEYNRKLSEQRAEKVLAHLHQAFGEAELDKQVGLLWLGEEYAQLDPSFCAWPRSGASDHCRPDELNRSAFLAWIECRL